MTYLLTNWKMHTTVDQAVTLVQAMQEGLVERAARGRQLPRVIVCPPFVSLVPVRAVLDEQLVHLGAQNCHWEKEGPHTGEISPTMLSGLTEYVMVGHSERRRTGESEEQIARKVAAAAEAGLTPFSSLARTSPESVPVWDHRGGKHASSLLHPAEQQASGQYEGSKVLSEPSGRSHERAPAGRPRCVGKAAVGKGRAGQQRGLTIGYQHWNPRAERGQDSGAVDNLLVRGPGCGGTAPRLSPAGTPSS